MFMRWEFTLIKTLASISLSQIFTHNTYLALSSNIKNVENQTPRMDGIVEHKEEHGLKEGETNPEFNLADPRKQLERGLKSRHIQFLALGMALNSQL